MTMACLYEATKRVFDYDPISGWHTHARGMWVNEHVADRRICPGRCTLEATEGE